jgi:hypothetical protein
VLTLKGGANRPVARIDVKKTPVYGLERIPPEVVNMHELWERD